MKRSRGFSPTEILVAGLILVLGFFLLAKWLSPDTAWGELGSLVSLPLYVFGSLRG